MKKPLIVRLKDAKIQGYKLNKLLGNITLPSLADLIYHSDLDANPREAKKGQVTDDIEESLETETEIFHFMTKGILVAAQKVEPLERDRFRISFEDPKLEGILDGGHNTLAIGRHILQECLTYTGDKATSERIVSKVKHWDDLKDKWVEYWGDIQEAKDHLEDTLVPVEIIFPADEADGLTYFQDRILKINAARNNNVQLTVETKAHQRGLYDALRAATDPKIANDVEWKANEGGRIKVRDLVALSLIPLAKLGFRQTELLKKSPAMLFSQKGSCVKMYNNLMEDPDNAIVKRVKGELVEIKHEGVLSALKLMGDLPALFDLTYELLPEAYNSVSPGFGRIRGVRIHDPESYEANKEKYSKKPSSTHFYQNSVKYDYGEGFVYPLVVGLSTLMELEDGMVRWKTDPEEFLRKNINMVMSKFKGMMEGQGFDPAKVGKSPSAYEVVSDAYQNVLDRIKSEVLEAKSEELEAKLKELEALKASMAS